MKPGPELHLLVPGVLGPMPHLGAASRPPQVPRLEALLGRADQTPAPGDDFISTLLHLFQLSRPSAGDWPSASLCLLADGGDPGGQAWLRADPVLLQPDMDRVLVFDSRSLGVQMEEAQALVELFNHHFAADGWNLMAPGPDRWYLSGPAGADLVTAPLHQVIGRGLYPFLPKGAGGAPWRRLLNEVQMLFFQAPVNQRREREGRPPISGIWLWGGGRCPEPVPVPWQRVWADEPLARGLALRAGVPLEPSAQGHAGPGQSLWFWDSCLGPVLDGDPESWLEALERLEAVLEHLQLALVQARLATLHLYPCDGRRFTLTRRNRRFLWRRSHPLERWLHQTEPGGGA